MSRVNPSKAVALASRELLIEQMNEQAANLAWLKDPSLVPEAATTYKFSPTTAVQRCRNLSVWMTERLAAWTAEGHSKLHLLEVFEKHGLRNETRVAMRQRMQRSAYKIYEPGNDAMAEIHAVVPAVAMRENVSTEYWGEIASEARKFGRLLARDGTEVQAAIRLLLRQNDELNIGFLDPRYIKLDSETGITTTDPIEGILEETKKTVDEIAGGELYRGTCLALLSRPRGMEGTMWGLTWDAFSFATTRSIYPQVDVESSSVPPQSTIDHLINRIDIAAHAAVSQIHS